MQTPKGIASVSTLSLTSCFFSSPWSLQSELLKVIRLAGYICTEKEIQVLALTW